MTAPVYVLEGAWDKPHEAPQILPYLSAFAQSHRTIDLQHRTFRCADDIKYYVSKVRKGAHALFYFACHGDEGTLSPSDAKSSVGYDAVKEALGEAKESSIGFVHFGCCDFVKSNDRRKTLSGLMNAAGAKWVSGYAKEVDWLASTLLDIALIADVYVPWRESNGQYTTRKAAEFFETYEQLARRLGFSGMYAARKEEYLFPMRLGGDV